MRCYAPTAQNAPIPQHGRIDPSGVRAMNDGMGPLLKLHHQSRKIRHYDAQIVNMIPRIMSEGDVRFHARDQHPRVIVQLAQRFPDRVRRIPRLGRQLAYFVGYHCEALRRGSTARSLDCGIDPQKPRLAGYRRQLVGHAADHLDGVQEAAEFPFQPRHKRDQGGYFIEGAGCRLVTICHDLFRTMRCGPQLLRRHTGFLMCRCKGGHRLFEIGEATDVILNRSV